MLIFKCKLRQCLINAVSCQFLQVHANLKQGPPQSEDSKKLGACGARRERGGLLASDWRNQGRDRRRGRRHHSEYPMASQGPELLSLRRNLFPCSPLTPPWGLGGALLPATHAPEFSQAQAAPS